DDAGDLGIAADHRVELALLRQLGQVGAVFAKNLVAALGAGVIGALVAANIHQRLIDSLLIDPEAIQDTRRRALALAADRDQQMLDPNILIVEAHSLFLGSLDQALRARRNIDLVAIAVLTIHLRRLLQLTLDALGDRLGIDAEAIECAG